MTLARMPVPDIGGAGRQIAEIVAEGIADALFEQVVHLGQSAARFRRWRSRNAITCKRI